jgi:hypothetical protein
MKALIIALLATTTVFAGSIKCIKDNQNGKLEININKHHNKGTLKITGKKFHLKCMNIETVIKCSTYKPGVGFNVEINKLVNQRIVRHFPAKVEQMANNATTLVNDTFGIVPCLESK